MLQKCILVGLITLMPLFADAIPDKVKLQNINVVKAAAEGLSEKLPQKVDNYTSLVKIEAKGEQLIYTYTINDPKMSDDQIAQRGKEKMKAPVTRGICTSSKRFLESGIAIRYVYISAKSKKKLFAFDVTQKDCKSID